MQSIFHIIRVSGLLRTAHRRPFNTSKIIEKSSRAPPAKTPRPQQHAGDTTRSSTTTKESPAQRSQSRFDSIYLRKSLVWIPVVGVLALHFPYEIDHINGASMSPFFNPNIDPTADAVELRGDWVLVRKRSIWEALPDPNDRKKARRSSSGAAKVANEQDPARFARGQIVVFHSPHNPGSVGVKRITGVPGDKVRALPGYQGSDDDDSIIIPWNHVWLEGDADSRDRSLDSNWYGPVSQNLVIGEVVAVLTPWWNPKWIDWRQHSWPAKRKGRVEEGAVAEAGNDPQLVERMKAWSDGSNQIRLEAMQSQPDAHVEHFTRSQNVRKHVREYYRSAAMLVARDDPDSDRWHLAQATVKQMEQLYGKDLLRQGMVRRSTRAPLNESDVGEPISRHQQAAHEAERMLNQQGWSIIRNPEGRARVKSIES